jgi:excisionase family DNA binding protein
MSLLMPIGIDPVADRDESQLNAAADALQSSDVAAASPLLEGLPEPVREAIADVIRRFARGEGVVVGSLETLLTTSEAAAMLGVSRTYLVQLLDAGELPCEFRGTHRRIRLGELVKFSAVFRQRRRAAVDEVARVSREAGLYDGDDF